MSLLHRFLREDAITLSLVTALSLSAAVSCGDPASVGGPSESGSPATSTVTASAETVEVDQTAILRLQARDSEGEAVSTGGQSVVFTVNGGSSQGVIGATVDNGDGTYRATFTGTAAGSPVTVGATIDDQPVTTPLPTLQVVAAAGEQQSPIASLVTSCADLSCDFDASGSEDPDGSIIGYTWDFGDGESGSGELASHTYTSAGDYMVVLTVTDEDGLAGQAQEAVSVSDAGDPPPSEECEATGSATCWYVAANGSDSNPGTLEQPFRRPQTAVERAGPGDFIYLRGGADFTLEHGISSNFSEGWFIIDPNDGGRDGQPGVPITLKSFPGERAVIRGTSDTNLNVAVNRNYWRVEGLRLIRGMILVAWYFAQNVHDIWIVGNEVSDAEMPPGNTGLIRIHGRQSTGGNPYNIFIHGNVLHDLWSEGGVAWSQDSDVEHHACFMIQHAEGSVEFVDNEAYNCASLFYFKYAGPGPTLIRGNRLHHARSMGDIRSARNRFENNVIHDIVNANTGWNLRSSSTDNVFLNNTWALHNGAVSWNGPMAGHTFRDNVIFGSIYHEWGSGTTGSWSASDIDANCVIGPSGLQAVEGQHDWDSYRSTFGHDPNAIRIVETDLHAVFADPDAGDFTLIGQAANSCAGKGAS